MQRPILESCIQLPIQEEVLVEVIEKAKDYALMHGAAMRSKDNFSSDALQVVNSIVFHLIQLILNNIFSLRLSSYCQAASQGTSSMML